jgi:hypothetical protein
MQPHDHQPREQLDSQDVVLLVQDRTELDRSHRTTVAGIGQRDHAKGRGILLCSMIAVVPQTRAVLGCLAHKPCVRLPAPPQEQRSHRRHRQERETDVWTELVKQGSTPTAPGRLVPVGDRAAQMVPCCGACLSPHPPVWYERRRIAASRPQSKRLLILRTSFGAGQAKISAQLKCQPSHGRQDRQTHLQLSFGALTGLASLQ